MTIEPQYIGAGVYLSGDAFGGVVLTTGHHNQRIADNVIILEPEVLANFLRVIEAAKQTARESLSASGPCVAAAPTQTRENEANGMTEADMEQPPFQPKQNHAQEIIR